MQNADQWRPSKYVFKRGRLAATSDTREVGTGSFLMADIVAGWYGASLKLYARGRLLDLGCGKMPLFEAYRDRVTEVVGVDWAHSPHATNHLDVECDLTQPLPFADGSFDTIILSDVLEHLAQPEALWSEMQRLLSHGGKIVMNVPFYYWLHEQPHDFYRYTEFALRRFVKIAGLELTELRSIGGAPEVVTDVVAKTLLKLPRSGAALSRWLQGFTIAWLRTRSGRRVSNATKDLFPLGYVLVASKA